MLANVTLLPRAYSCPGVFTPPGRRSAWPTPRDRLFALADLAMSCAEGVWLFLELEDVCAKRDMPIPGLILADGLCGITVMPEDDARIRAWRVPGDVFAPEVSEEAAQRFLRFFSEALVRRATQTELERTLVTLQDFLAALVGSVRFAEIVEFP